jgi:hypothetical protein
MQLDEGEVTRLADAALDIAASGPDFLTRHYHPDWLVLKRGTSRGDGRDVTLSVAAYPARFYRIAVDGKAMSTGSGCEALAATVFNAAMDGMLGVCDEREAQ